MMKEIFYSIEIKFKAVKMFLEQDFSHKEIMAELGIRSKVQIRLWFNAYRLSGIAGLQDKRTLTKLRKELTIFSDVSRIKQLEMENELLKKLLP